MRDMLKKSKHLVLCTGILATLSFFGCLMIVMRHWYTGRAGSFFLIWNLFLAWIPFAISLMMHFLLVHPAAKNRGFILILLGLPWLLFYPNAPYMLTDYIHFRYSHTFLYWYDLVTYSIFIFTGFLLGFLSLYLVNRIVEKVINKISGWLFVLIVLFVSSYGIYLGRVLRWNSWDVLINPVELIQSVFVNINARSVAFALIYGSMLTLIYAFLYGLTHLKSEEID